MAHSVFSIADNNVEGTTVDIHQVKRKKIKHAEANAMKAHLTAGGEQGPAEGMWTCNNFNNH